MHLKNFLFVIRYVPDRCKTQRMCDKAAVMEKVPSFHVKYRNTGKFKFLFFNSFLIASKKFSLGGGLSIR